MYSGEQFDQHSQLQYLRARYYDASTGRFMGLDSFSGDSRNPQSYNKYLYTHGDPINGSDPTGNDLVSTVGAISVQVSLGALQGAAIGTAAGAIIGGVDAYLGNTNVLVGATNGALSGLLFGGAIGGGGVLGGMFLGGATQSLITYLLGGYSIVVGSVASYESLSDDNYLQAIFRFSTGLIGGYAAYRGRVNSQNRPLNIGCEMDPNVPTNAINLQPYTALKDGWATSRDAKSMAALLMKGMKVMFYDARKQTLPFENNSVNGVYMNSTPMAPHGSKAFPGVRFSEIRRILKPGTALVRDGVTEYVKPAN